MAELNAGIFIVNYNLQVGNEISITIAPILAYDPIERIQLGTLTAHCYITAKRSGGSTGSVVSIDIYNYGVKLFTLTKTGLNIWTITDIDAFTPENLLLNLKLTDSSYTYLDPTDKEFIHELFTKLELKLTDDNMLNAIKYNDLTYPPEIHIDPTGYYQTYNETSLAPYWNRVSYQPIQNNPYDYLPVGLYSDQSDIGNGFSRFWVYEVKSKTTGQTLWSKSDAEFTEGYYWENLSPPDVVVKYDEGGQYLEITNKNPDGIPFYGLVYKNGGASAVFTYGLLTPGKSVEKYYIETNNLQPNIPDAYTANRIFNSKDATRWYSEISNTVITPWNVSEISFSFDPINGVITASESFIGSIKTFTVSTSDGQCEQIDRLNWRIITSGTYTCSIETNYNFRNTIVGQSIFTIVAALDTPVLNYDYESNQLEWKAIENATEYQIVLNGEVIDSVSASAFRLLIEEEEKKAKWRVVNV